MLLPHCFRVKPAASVNAARMPSFLAELPLVQTAGWANNVPMKRSRQFASDNYSGVCPEAWSAMAEANAGHEVSYGNDAWTQRAAAADRDHRMFLKPFSMMADVRANTSSKDPMPSTLMTPCSWLYFWITGTVFVSCSCKRFTIFAVLES